MTWNIPETLANWSWNGPHNHLRLSARGNLFPSDMYRTSSHTDSKVFCIAGNEKSGVTFRDVKLGIEHENQRKYLILNVFASLSISEIFW